MKNKFIGLLTISFSLFFIWFVIHTANDLSNAREKILKSPNVIDVTDLISTRVLITSESLPTDGGWVSKEFDDSKWTSLKIPTRQIVNEKNYAMGNYAYYRIRIPKEAFGKLSQLKNEVSFALQYVLFSKLDVIVNGRPIKSSSNPQNAIEYLQVFPIPEGEDVVVGLKGLIKSPLDTGVDHRNEILIGKGNEFNELFVSGFKRGTAFQLVFILCEGSILFIFALIFLLLKVESSFVKFFFFGLCTMVEELIAGDYLTPFVKFQYQIYIYNFANVGAALFVFLFFAELLRVEIDKKKFWVFTIALIIVSTLIATDALNQNYLFDIGKWMKFWNVIIVFVIAFYTPKIFKTDQSLFAVVIVVIGLYLWGVAPVNNIGLNFKRYGNLLLFVMVAYQTFVMFRREQNLLQLKERQLLEQEKDVVMGKTASLLAHDVRKPLDQMKLVLEKMSSGEADKEFIELAKKDIDFSIESVNQQINDMMNFSKTSDVSLKDISFYKVISHGIKQVMSVHQEMDIALEYHFKTDKKILGDETKLSGIIVNLVSNAVEAIRDIGHRYNGRIRFETSLSSGELIFKIFNDGPEIPEDMVNDIFKPLFTHGKSNGTGLGLASVLKAVNDHNGSIKVENITNEGVVFTITFMASQEVDSYDMEKFLGSSRAYEYKMSKPVEKIEGANLRILVLESNPQEIKKLVEELPYKTSISFAKDSKTARELAAKMRFDLYILNTSLGAKELVQSDLSYLTAEIVLYSNAEELPHLGKICQDIYPKRTRILLVDDTKLFQVAWQMFHGNHNIECVASPEEALQLISNPDRKFDAYVLDFHFSNSSINGQGLGEKIRESRKEARIFISSSIDQSLDGFQSISKRDYDVRKYLN